MRILKSTFFSLFFIVMACSTLSDKEKEIGKSLSGNWGFLDPYGNYNEAFFGDTSYITYNRIYGIMPAFSYQYFNDSLWSTIDKRKEGMAPIARIEWLDDNRLVILSGRHSDTLERIDGAIIHLGNTDPKKDSVKFRMAFNSRYEKFLVDHEILTWEEIEEFRNDSIIPDDVLEKLKGN